MARNFHRLFFTEPLHLAVFQNICRSGTAEGKRTTIPAGEVYGKHNVPSNLMGSLLAYSSSVVSAFKCECQGDPKTGLVDDQMVNSTHCLEREWEDVV